MCRSFIFSLTALIVACSSNLGYAQRSSYPTQDHPENYPQREIARERDRSIRNSHPETNRFRPAPDRYEARVYGRTRPTELDQRQERMASQQYQNRQKSRYEYEDRRSYEMRPRENRRYASQRPDRFRPVGYRQDGGQPQKVDPLISPNRPKLRDNELDLGEPLPRPNLSRQDRPDGAMDRIPENRGNQRPINPEMAPEFGGQMAPNSHNMDSGRMRPVSPSAAHPSDCGCSSCTGGHHYDQGYAGNSYDSYPGDCDSGCDSGMDRRYSRYFQDGYDRIEYPSRRGCRKGLCGGCKSCLGGRRNSFSSGSGSCFGDCGGNCGSCQMGRRGRRSGRGGCLTGRCRSGNCGCGDQGISDYEYKFYGPRPGSDDFYGDCDTGVYDNGGCDTGGCYDNRFAANSGLGQRNNVYHIVGASWLLLRRDSADFYPLSYENAMPTNRLLVDSADQSAQNGVEVFYARQNDCGNGWELRYWGLYENQADAYLGNMPQTELGGFANVNYPTASHLQSHFNSADHHGVTRDSQLHNAEFNVFRTANGCGPRGKFILRGLGGFRVVNFQDEFEYFSYDSTSWGGAGFNRINYQIDTTNTILATQLGAIGEYCISPRIRLSLGAKAGVGVNLISAKQQVINSAGVYARDVNGNEFCFHNEQTEVSAFGEINTSMLYHVNDCFRLRFGYRVIGFTGVALSYDQIPYDFSDIQELNNVKSDGSLFYHGLQLGGEYCF